MGIITYGKSVQDEAFVVNKGEVEDFYTVDGHRVYPVVESSGLCYRVVSATTVLNGLDESTEETIMGFYAAKLAGVDHPKHARPEHYEQAYELTRFAQRQGTVFHNSSQRAGELGLNHRLFDLPCFSTAKKVYFEQRVYHPKFRVGGRPDIIILHYDDTLSIHDIKSHNRFYSDRLEERDVGVWELERGVQDSKRGKWWKQMSIYDSCWEYMTGKPFSRSSVLLYTPYDDQVQEVFELTPKKLRAKFTRSIEPKIDSIVDPILENDFLDLDI